jgi:hypothetical protein
MSDTDAATQHIDALIAERDAARADLAAATARIAELEEGKDGPYSCCACCPDDDPDYHAENPPNSHSTWCKTCGTPTAVAERDRLQSRIDKALALADEWEARQGQRVEIDRDGTCDGCAEWKDELVASYPTPDSDPWLCAECDAEGRREITELRSALAADTPTTATAEGSLCSTCGDTEPTGGDVCCYHACPVPPATAEGSAIPPGHVQIAPHGHPEGWNCNCVGIYAPSAPATAERGEG